MCNYLRRRLASEGVRVCVFVSVIMCVCVRQAATARRISLGGEGNTCIQCCVVYCVDVVRTYSARLPALVGLDVVETV